MGLRNAALWRRAVVALAATAALAFPMGAKAEILNGLSIRAGAFFPTMDSTRDLTDTAVWGGGLQYSIPWFPKLLSGETWSTTISADFHYSERGGAILRFIPVSINQIYTFEEQNGHTPYAGFCVTAGTFGTTGTLNNPSFGYRQPTVTRWGGGLILGLNVDKHLYVEGRYEWFDKHNTYVNPEGFRAYLGYKF